MWKPRAGRNAVSTPSPNTTCSLRTPSLPSSPRSGLGVAQVCMGPGGLSYPRHHSESLSSWLGSAPSWGLPRYQGGGSWFLLNPPDTGAPPATWWRERSARTPRVRSGRSLGSRGNASGLAWWLPRLLPNLGEQGLAFPRSSPLKAHPVWPWPQHPWPPFPSLQCLGPPHPPSPARTPWPYLVKTQEAMPLTSSRRMQL